MRDLLGYYKRSFILEIKKTIIYPFSFWIIALIWPLYSVVQIVFLETIYSQTNNFAGYTKYEAYILFGTYTMVQTMGHLFFYRRLAEFAFLIKGNARESLDIALTKPIDSQIFTTSGRFNLGNLSPTIVGLVVALYGISHLTHPLGLINIVSYIAVIPLGVFMYYIIYSLISMLLFWSPEMQITESLWASIGDFGQYPSSLYQGTMGIILNIIIPITLMASVPVDFLLGKKPLYMILIYFVIVAVLLLFDRLFWNFSVKKYSSSSS